MAIKRIWHGWTTPENAAAYRDLLRTDVFPGIEAKAIRGYRGIELLQHDGDDEVGFITIMTFESIQNVIDFQGQDYERAYVPDAARAVLSRWDETCRHYETLEIRSYE
ncbi:MAG: antibiotic biosynthesis monooxygenase [Acidobacteria bacterium]|nr:antibiotic biosynthesis monooxygenase [Acidobacteriota bacterium]